MGVVVRGVKNAFRSGVRSVAVILILAIGMGLGLSMLLANQAVKERLQAVKTQVGTIITVNPAGSRDFQGGGEPLTTDELAKVKTLPHVAGVSEQLSLADEPAGNLDSQTGAAIFELLHKLSRAQKTTIIAVTHDLSIAGKTDKTFKIADGKLVKN